jgi:hypothetical protein
MSKVQKILSQILKPEYYAVLANWETSANYKEIKGLKTIGKIYTHKGQRKFINKQKLADPRKISLKTVEKNFVRNGLTSSYS